MTQQEMELIKRFLVEVGEVKVIRDLLLLCLLEETGNNKTKAAKRMGISLRSFRMHVKRICPELMRTYSKS